MNPLDLVAILLVVLAVLLGFRSGALPQMGGLLGAVGGCVLAILALPAVAEPLGGLDPTIRTILVLAGLLVAVGLGESLGSALGRRAAHALGTGILGAADRVAGGLAGAAQALLIVWLVGGLLAIGPVARLAEAAHTSTAIRGLNAVLPPPTEIAAGLGDLLDDSGLPEVFLGFEPLPRPAVDRPSDATTRRIAAAAEAGTLRITAATCDYTTSGSGVVVADQYVVTNAHVVAGARDGAVRTADSRGRGMTARVVLFDPESDIALLRVDGDAGAPLRFAANDPPRGAIGATLGYPGGGALTILPAAVTGAHQAVGRDIYGESPVRRDILELRAAIERGDSGGPLILDDGSIGGLVFAEARSNAEVGYALTPTSVAARIAPGLGRTGAVNTGPCLR